MKYINALFELGMALASFGFFVSNVGQFRDPTTHPQWRFAIAASLFIGVIALGFLYQSLLKIRREAKK